MHQAIAAIVGAVLVLGRKRQKEQSKSEQWSKMELAAKDVDPEAQGYGLYMADSNGRSEVEGISAIPEAPEDRQMYDLVPEMPEALPNELPSDVRS